MPENDNRIINRPIESTTVIFVNSPTQYYPEAMPDSCRDYATIPPLGLGYVATAASEVIGPHNVTLIDAEHLRLSPAETARLITARQPTYLGINATSPNFSIASDIISIVGSKLRTKIVMGGTHAILCADRILQDDRIGKYIFGVCTGDGEPAIQGLLKGADRSCVPNFKYRADTGEITSSRYRERVSIAELNDRYLDRRFFANDPLVYGKTVESYLLGSRGCPFRCAYCAAPRLGTEFFRRSEESIQEELKSLISGNVNYVRFVDDLLLSSENRVHALQIIFDALGIDTLNFGFEATARANIAAKFAATTWQMLAQMGCKELEIGIESGSPRVLRIMGKRTTVNDVVSTVKSAVAYGIKVKGFLMVGYPTETKSDLDLTIQLAYRLKNIGGDAIRFSPVITKAYPGTELYYRYQDVVQRLSDDMLLDLSDWCCENYPIEKLASLKARTRYNAVHSCDGRPLVLSELTGGASLREVIHSLVALIQISSGDDETFFPEDEHSTLPE